MLATLWSDIWANFLTPSVWTLLAITVSHMLHRQAMATHMDGLRREALETEKRLHKRITQMTGKRLIPPPAAGEPDDRR